jgi:hypothetical protein
MYTSVTKILLVLWLCLPPFAYASAEQSLGEIITAKAHDKREDLYAEALLEKILKKSGASVPNFQVIQAKSEFSRKRMLSELVSGKNLQVVAEISSQEWDDKLIPIRIPIRKGINGYRLFLINNQDQAAFRDIKTLQDLKNITTGSEYQWSLRHMLETAGFNVVTGDTYATLFDMLKFGRFKSLGRGVDEVFREYEMFAAKNTDLIVEESLGLYFPLPTYFYVSPRHPDLADLIENGLKTMIDDGSFDRHFISYYQQDILNARLSERRIFKIPNPNLVVDPSLDKVATWLDPNLPTVFGFR